jgi:DNA-binding NtrC family response regulator
VKTVIALFGQADDEREVCERLREDGYDVSGYARTPDESAVRAADIVVIDQPPTESLAQDPWRVFADICLEKPVILFTSCEGSRHLGRRWGAYYVGETPRAVGDVAFLIGRARSAALATRPSPSQKAMVGEGRAMLRLRCALHALALAPTTDLLLRGEPGSGKRTFARALHVETFPSGAFVETNDPKIIDLAIQSGNAATLFLGDLTRWSNAQQARMLRSLRAPRSTSVPLRFVAVVDSEATTERAADDAVSRAALLQHFQATVEIPPLRARREDLPLLAVCLLGRVARERGLRTPKLSADAVAALRAQEWPGNIRQLESALSRALELAKDGVVDVAHLNVDSSAATAMSAPAFRLPPDGLNLLALERDVLLQALQLARGNRTRAAALLGLTRDQVRYRLSKLAAEGSFRDGIRVA